jgi:hypothetical protein
MSKLKEEFNRVAEISSQITLDLQEEVRDLKKNEVARVFMAVMEYPVPPTRQLTSQKEVDTYQMAVGLKEMQMKMGVINLAMKEQEANNGEDS